MFKKYFSLFLGPVNALLAKVKHHSSRLFVGWKAKKHALECVEHKQQNCCSHTCCKKH